MRYLQGAAGAAFTLTVASLILFWTVKDTKPSGDAVLPILYAAAGVSALIWLGAELWKHWARNRKRAPGKAGSIAARHAISAGGSISATRSIEAGHGIQAGGDIHSGGSPFSDADRRRIVRETEGRLAREIHDPTLQIFDKKNKEQAQEEPQGSQSQTADRLAGLHAKGFGLKERVQPEHVPIQRAAIHALKVLPQYVAHEQHEAVEWDANVRAELWSHARRFVPEWEAEAKLPPNRMELGVPMVTADAKAVAAFLDAKLTLLFQIIRELREGR